MKPKLIILNGPLGIGKSTLANKYANDHPLTLLLDIDNLRTNISRWREKDEQSAESSKQMAVMMAKVHLSLGHDVVVPQIMRKQALLEQFEQIAHETGADMYEILLVVDKDEAIHRFKERSIANGYATGFRPGGLVDAGGREAKLASMYDEMAATASQRPNTIVIEPELGMVEETYNILLQKISAQ